jgi:L,D-transpeptidase ErfK/SrfK
MPVMPAQRLGTVVTLVVLASLAGGPPALAQDAGRFQLTGQVTTHVVAPGDSLTALSARFGVETRTLAADNGIGAKEALPAGRALRIDSRHIVPSALATSPLVVNIPQRMLFHRDLTITGLPVAVGRADWPTPIGSFTIATREENPTWDVPQSILDEARRAGRKHPIRVPPGPNNPLGAFWLGLSQGSVGVHGTIAPSSIYRFASHGCIRLHPDDIAWLFPRVAVGDMVALVYEPVLLAAVDGRVFLEVHTDAYQRATSTLARVRELAVTRGLTDQIDWDAAQRVLRQRHGIARDVTADGARP